MITFIVPKLLLFPEVFPSVLPYNISKSYLSISYIIFSSTGLNNIVILNSYIHSGNALPRLLSLYIYTMARDKDHIKNIKYNNIKNSVTSNFI